MLFAFTPMIVSGLAGNIEHSLAIMAEFSAGMCATGFHLSAQALDLRNALRTIRQQHADILLCNSQTRICVFSDVLDLLVRQWLCHVSPMAPFRRRAAVERPLRCLPPVHLCGPDRQ